MFDIQRQYLFFVALLAYLLCLVFLPASVCSQNLQSATPPLSSGSVSDGTYQKNEIESFLAKFNGCAWQRVPNNPSRDVYLELKDKTLILYEYIKDKYYCYFTSSICFTQVELLRIKVEGYDTMLTDQYGNVYQVVINRNGETITIHGKDNTGGREYIIGTFVKHFCSDHI
jgi:hypothetical protein